MTKTDKKDETPLSGAKVQLQSQSKDGTWKYFTDSAKEYTTDNNGQVILPDTVVQAIQKWGGTGNDEAFRFVETEAPPGYPDPDGTWYGNTYQDVPAKFISNVIALDATSQGTQNFTLTNEKEEKGQPIKVYYWIDGDYNSQTTVAAGTLGATATIPKPSFHNDYDFEKAVINNENNTVYSWPSTVKFTNEDQQVWIYYTSKQTADVTVKVTMVNESGNPISYPAGTTDPLWLFDKTTAITQNSSVSGSTITFPVKIEKDKDYRIYQKTAISGYQIYNQDGAYDTGNPVGQTPMIGVSSTNFPMFGGIPYPTEEWTSTKGVSLKYDSSTSTLEVKITNKQTPSYALKQLKVPTQTYNAGIDPLETDDWIDLFTNSQQLAVVDTNNKDAVVQYLDKGDFTPSLSLSTPWNSSAGTRTFDVTITPTTALNTKYSGLTAITAQATLTFEAVPEPVYQFQIIVRNQDKEPVSFDGAAQPFEGIALGESTWNKAVINPTNLTLVEFQDMDFVMNQQYRIRQVAAANADYTIWSDGSQTKAFHLEDESTLSLLDGAGVGNVGSYNVANREAQIAEGWTARYDTSTKTLTFYITNQEDIGALTFTVPNDMDFGQVETPVREQKDIFLQAADKQPNWKILVSDQRNNNRNQWAINAKMNDRFVNTANQKQLPSGILKFKASPTAAAQDLANGAQLYQSVVNPPLGQEMPVTWTSTSGFYLDLQAFGYYPKGEYQATIDFTLETTP